MATIALYANKINQMSGLIIDTKKSVTDYKSELSALKTKMLTINKSVCNLDDVIGSIQTSTQTQELKIDSLDTFNRNSENFVADVARIDSKVTDVVNKRKDDFYKEYSYLKPDSEKNGWEKFRDNVLKPVGQWCKNHWVEIVAAIATVIVTAIVAVVIILTAGIGMLALTALLALIAVSLTGCTNSDVSTTEGESSTETPSTEAPTTTEEPTTEVDKIAGTSVDRVSREQVTSSNEPLVEYGEKMTINATYVYQELLDAGWTHEAICAILGNMQVESYLNPGKGEDGDSQTGYGLLQWTPYKGVDYYRDWADSEGLQYDDIDTQLERILAEVSNPSLPPVQWCKKADYPNYKISFSEFTQCDNLDISYLTEVFMGTHEGPRVSTNHLDKRIEHAEHWDNYFQ